MADRGIEWTIDRRTVMIEVGGMQKVEFRIAPAVDTTGLIAGDVHLHPSRIPGVEIRTGLNASSASRVKASNSRSRPTTTATSTATRRSGLLEPKTR